MPSISEAVETLRTFVEDAVAEEPYLSQFSGEGGVDVVTFTEEPENAETVGRPYLLLNFSDRPAPAWGPDMREGFVTATAKATSFSGATVGAENPVGSHELLSNALTAIVTNGYRDLRELGLLRTQIATGQTSRKPQGDSAPDVLAVEHTISFIF